MAEKMDVSIIVPAFHGEKYLDDLLQMIKRNVENAKGIQTELILVNDSPDDVPDFSAFRSEAFPVNILLNEENLGIQRARIRGLDNARGTYILFLDQDDWIADDAIFQLYRDVDGKEAISGNWEREKFIGGTVRREPISGKIDEDVLKLFLRGGNHIGPPGHCMLRKDCIPESWKKNIMKINGADDHFLWLCMLTEGHRFSYCDKTVYVHKLNELSYSMDHWIMTDSEVEAFLLAADIYKYSKRIRRRYLRNVEFRKTMMHLVEDKEPVIKRRLLYLKYPEEVWYKLKSYL